jgi:hypothetical protein
MAAPGIPDFLKLDEVARILRAGRTFVYEQARLWRETDGREGIPNRQVGNQIRVPTARFEEVYGIVITSIPPPEPRPRKATKEPEPPVRRIDSARRKPRPRRDSRAEAGQDGLPFAR